MAHSEGLDAPRGTAAYGPAGLVPGVGSGVGSGVGLGVGLGVGGGMTCVGRGDGVGAGVGAGVGLGVGRGVGRGVRRGVAAGVGDAAIPCGATAGDAAEELPAGPDAGGSRTGASLEDPSLGPSIASLGAPPSAGASDAPGVPVAESTSPWGPRGSDCAANAASTTTSTVKTPAIRRWSGSAAAPLRAIGRAPATDRVATGTTGGMGCAWGGALETTKRDGSVGGGAPGTPIR